MAKINDHQNIYHFVYDLSIPRFLPRQWVTKIVWKWAADKKELTVVYDDVKHDAFQESEAYQRASATAIYQYKQEVEVGGIPQTKVTYTVQVDLGGAIPKRMQNRQGVGDLMYGASMPPTSPAPPPNPPPPLQVSELDAEALRQELGNRRGEQPAPGVRYPEPRRAVH
jgi:hypothetical protein